MTLGMIWTIILRFAIQDISVEGLFYVALYSYFLASYIVMVSVEKNLVVQFIILPALLSSFS